MFAQLKAYANLIIAGVLIVGALGLYFYVSHLQSQITVKQEKIDAMVITLKTQNDAIELLKTHSDERDARVKQALETADKKLKAAQRQANSIYALPTPKDKVCEEALRLGNER